MRADFMNISSANADVSMQTESSSNISKDVAKTSETFAGFMNRSMRPSTQTFEQKTQELTSKTDTDTKKSENAVSSYERYSYKENRISSVKEADTSISEEKLKDTKQTIVDAICDEYGVSEEEIEHVLESMGLSVLDLLIPQNLADFMVQLTNVASAEELLLDDGYLQVMGMMDALADGLSKELNVDKNGLLELVSQMESVAEEIELPEMILESILDEISMTNETVMPEETFISEEITPVQEEIVPKTSESEEVLESEPENKIEVQIDKKETVSDVDTQQTKESSLTDVKEKEENFANESDENEHAFFHQESTAETVVTSQTDANVNVTTSDVQQPQFSSYLSADSMKVMEQVVQQMKVSVSAETTSLEMQLNPENLGKVYINISSEKGIVNAHFHATNEAVKEVLEAQIASLRENLVQAGVKVDSVEVTIASHEFERNLEQNQQGFEQSKQQENTNTTAKRRNISMDTLDELSGMMTEEELLAAQIMKDNGNSIDFTA